jgi:hypothetical protein
MNRARLVSLSLFVCTLGAGSALLAPAQNAAANTPTVTSTVTTPTTTTTTSTTTTTPTPPPAARQRISAGRLFRVDHMRVTVIGERVPIAGTVTPYVAGQRVLLRAYVGTRLFTKALLNVKPVKGHTYGVYRWVLRAPASGKVTVHVYHAASATLGEFSSELDYTALRPSANFGETGPIVRLIQQRLLALHLYIPQTGVYDQKTGLAIDTYHRLLGWGVSQIADPRTVDALIAGKGRFIVHFPHQGFHAEGDLSIQVLALINGSKVSWLLPISSGKPSTPTVLGSFQIYYREPEFTSDGMYFSDFFHTGYAIHGYDPSPDYPASHGCMRLPMVDAIPVYDRLALGEWVDTYYTSGYRYDWVGNDI